MGKKEKKEHKALQVLTNTVQKRQAVFGFVYGLAHLVDEFRQPTLIFGDTSQALFHILVFAFAAALILKPSSTLRLGLMAAANVVVVILQMPQMPNHNMIFFMVDVAILVTIARSDFSKKGQNGLWLAQAEPFIRAALFVVYGSATIAKFNVSWFNPEVSCATVMPAREFAFLPFAVDWQSLGILPFAIVGAELAIWLLLLFPKLRPAVLVFAVVFHTMISLTPVSQGLGFSFLLFSILFLYLPDDAMAHLYSRGTRALQFLRRTGTLEWVAYGYIVLLMFLAALSFFYVWPAAFDFVRYLPMLFLLLVFGFVLSKTAFDFRKSVQVKPAIGVKGAAQVIVLLLVLLNSLSPYLGIKTEATMTMFSNLQVEYGATNHLFIPRLPVLTPADDLVAVLESSNQKIKIFEQTGELYTWHELRREMAKTPSASITYDRGGDVFSYGVASENAELVSTDPLLHKLLGFRNASVVDACLW